MPRDITTAFNNFLQGQHLTVANCVKIIRRDGVILGLTSHDEKFTTGGVTYLPEGSMSTTALKQTADSGVDNMEVEGFLSSDRISEDDLLAGLYDMATIELFQVNYADLTMGRMLLLRARLGEITFTEGKFTTELRSLSDILKQQIGEISSAGCRVKRLGDARCKVNLASFTDEAALDTGTQTRDRIRIESTSRGSGYYDFGVVRFTSGANVGIEREIKQQAGVTIDLRTQLPYNPSPGDTVELEAGCDRAFLTCKNKFNNAINFHGEPHLPGNLRIAEPGRPPS